MAMIAVERETVINASDGDDVIRIWTAQRRFITRLQRNPRVKQVGSGEHDGTPYYVFEVPASEWNPVSGVKRASRLTDEQKKATAERLRQARESGK